MTHPTLLSVTAARQQLLALISPVQDTHSLSLTQALGAVLAETVYAPFDLPRADLSAMDGYAVRAADLDPAASTRLSLSGTAWAGHPYLAPLQPGQAVRIMTGGWMPTGADTVVMQEVVHSDATHVHIPPGQRARQHVRPAGEEYRAGQVVLKPGVCLGAAALGLLASFGRTQVQAFRPLTVALYSSGDELCPPTTPLGAGQIYDSNRVGLSALLTRLGVQVNDAGILPDRLDAVTDALRQTATQADVILTSGGVSVGEADYLTTAVRALGELAVWKVAMKPGKPFAFGTIGKTLYFGLPGNPVSALVTFQQFVQDALRTRMGMNPIPEPLLLPAIALDALKKEPGRAEFQRGWLSTSTQGLTVRSTGAQDSHLLSSLLQANCYIVLPTEQGNTPAGSVVQVQPLLP